MNGNKSETRSQQARKGQKEKKQRQKIINQLFLSRG